jgi:hypothetical protein
MKAARRHVVLNECIIANALTNIFENSAFWRCPANAEA